MARQARRSLRSKFTIYLIIFVIFFLNVTMGYFYYMFKSHLTMELGNKLITVAQLSSTHFRNNILIENISKLKEGDKHKNIYNRVKNTLNLLVSKSKSEAIYIFNKNHESLVDSREDINIGDKYPHLVVDRPEMETLFTGVPVFSKMFRSSGGKLILSAYAPILSDNKSSGLYIGVDASAKLLEVADKLIENMMLFEVGGLIIVLIISYIFSYQILKPISHFVDTAEKIADGDLSARIELKRKDELGFLAETFNRMIKSIEDTQRTLEREHKLASEKALDMQNLYEYIISSMHSGMITIDKNKKIIQMNRIAEQILSAERNRLINNSYYDFFKKFPDIFNGINEVFATEKAVYLKDIELEPGQGTRYLDLSVSPLLNHKTEFVGVTILCNDITKIKLLEDEITEKKRLSSIGTMAAMVAHEIRNPLTGLSGFIELLERKIESNEQARKLIGKILDEINKLNNITTDFLTFAGKLSLVKTITEIEPILEDVIKLIEDETSKKDIVINTNFKYNPRLSIDPEKIERVILNICINSLQSMQNKGILTISTRKKDNYNMFITIEDNGEGIPDEVLSKIFEPFYTTKSSGTGLGLSITKRIIELHNGTIEIISEIKHGTTVIITLPVVR